MRERSNSAIRPPQPLDPPAVAVAPHGAPVVERVAPELADGAERVGRRARPQPGLEELGMVDLVGAVRRDVDGHVPDQPHAPRRGIRPQRAPLAIEAHLVLDGALPGEPRPSPRSSTPPARGTRPPPPGSPAHGASREGPATPRTPTRPCTASPRRRAARAARPATTSARLRAASRRIGTPPDRAVLPEGKSTCSNTPLERGRFMRAGAYQPW